jgi:hypothetical protein
MDDRLACRSTVKMNVDGFVAPGEFCCLFLQEFEMRFGDEDLGLSAGRRGLLGAVTSCRHQDEKKYQPEFHDDLRISSSTLARVTTNRYTPIRIKTTPQVILNCSGTVGGRNNPNTTIPPVTNVRNETLYPSILEVERAFTGLQ